MSSRCTFCLELGELATVRSQSLNCEAASDLRFNLVLLAPSCQLFVQELDIPTQGATSPGIPPYTSHEDVPDEVRSHTKVECMKHIYGHAGKRQTDDGREDEGYRKPTVPHKSQV